MRIPEPRVAAATRADSLLEAQREVLEMIVRGAPLPEVLAELCHVVEAQAEAQVRAAILLVDESGRCLFTGAAPSLPASYSAAIDGIEIAPDVGTCCAAAARKERVVTVEIASASGWSAIRHLPLELGLQAAWSLPIMSASGRVLGTFGTYFFEPREPLPEEQRLVEVLARTAALAIERDAAERAQKQDRERLNTLLERERQQARLFEKVAHAALVIHAADSVDAVLAAVAEQAKLMLDAERASASLAVPREQSPGVLLVPLLWRGGASLGIVEVADKRAGAFDETDEAILMQLAQIAAVAIDNAQLYDRLREQDRSKDEFLATLAHELRNPLAPIRTGLSVLQFAKDEAQEQRVREMMERQLGHLVRMVDDLLDISRVTLGKVELKKERIDFRVALHSALETTRPLIEAGRHHFDVRVPDQPLLLDADATRLAQMIANLVNNAAKYTPQGGQIELIVDVVGTMLRVRVRDSGVGIPAEMVPRVFEMFTQVGRSIERAQGGLGIGLTLVRRLAEMHGGSIEAESAGIGQGSTFTLQLPLALPVAQAPRHVRPSRRPSSGQPLRIAVIDDNVDGAESLSLLLEISGHQTRIAHDGMSGLALVGDFKPHVVFLDIGLPGLDGYEVAKQLRAQPIEPRPTLVALTGWGSEEDRQRAYDAGFDKHVVKPCDPSMLGEIVAGVPRGASRA